jgi:hypothetical protein
MQRRARAAAEDKAHFTIGFMPGKNATPIIREFASSAAHLTIDVMYTSITDQSDYVLDGRVDACFVRLPLPTEALTVIPLFPEPRVAALPHNHELADLDIITIDQLQSFPLLQDPADVPEWHGASLHDAVREPTGSGARVRAQAIGFNRPRKNARASNRNCRRQTRPSSQPQGSPSRQQAPEDRGRLDQRFAVERLVCSHVRSDLLIEPDTPGPGPANWVGPDASTLA